MNNQKIPIHNFFEKIMLSADVLGWTSYGNFNNFQFFGTFQSPSLGDRLSRNLFKYINVHLNFHTTVSLSLSISLGKSSQSYFESYLKTPKEMFTKHWESNILVNWSFVQSLNAQMSVNSARESKGLNFLRPIDERGLPGLCQNHELFLNHRSTKLPLKCLFLIWFCKIKVLHWLHEILHQQIWKSRQPFPLNYAFPWNYLKWI
jgi:hypothetical protein